MPSVFNVALPDGLEHFKFIYHLLELPSELGLELLINGACLGGYRHRMLISSLWPFALVFIVAATTICWKVTFARRAVHARYSIYEVTRAQLQGTVPLILVLTFALVPSMSSRIFQECRE